MKRSREGMIPSWSTKWGITSLSLVMLILLLLLAFLPLPEKVQTEALLHSWPPPLIWKNIQAGRIDTLGLQDGQQVEEGQWLLTLEGGLPPARVQPLQERLENWLISPVEEWSLEDGFWQLDWGPLHAAVGEIRTAARQYQFLYTLYRGSGRQTLLRQQRQRASARDSALAAQQQVLANISNLALRDLGRLEELEKKGAISLLEKEQAEIVYLQYRQQQQQLQTARIDQAIQQQEWALQSLEIQETQKTSLQNALSRVQTALKALQTALYQHLKYHSITAPFRGQVLLVESLRSGQYVAAGQALFALRPYSTDTQFVATLHLPASSSLKITPGMTARINLQGLPGTGKVRLEGTIQHIASIPREGQYRARVELADSTLPALHSRLMQREALPIQATILVRKRTLLQRLWEKIRPL